MKEEHFKGSKIYSECRNHFILAAKLLWFIADKSIYDFKSFFDFKCFLNWYRNQWVLVASVPDFFILSIIIYYRKIWVGFKWFLNELLGRNLWWREKWEKEEQRDALFLLFFTKADQKQRKGFFKDTKREFGSHFPSFFGFRLSVFLSIFSEVQYIMRHFTCSLFTESHNKTHLA